MVAFYWCLLQHTCPDTWFQLHTGLNGYELKRNILKFCFGSNVRLTAHISTCFSTVFFIVSIFVVHEHRSDGTIFCVAFSDTRCHHEIQFYIFVTQLPELHVFIWCLCMKEDLKKICIFVLSFSNTHHWRKHFMLLYLSIFGSVEWFFLAALPFLFKFLLFKQCSFYVVHVVQEVRHARLFVTNTLQAKCMCTF